MIARSKESSSPDGNALQRVILASLLALAGCQSGPPDTHCVLGHLTDLPLTRVHDSLFTEATLNGVKLNMLFDTGSELTIVTESAADRMKLFSDPAIGRLEGLGGSRSVSVLNAKSFEIGELKGKNLPLLVSEIGLRVEGQQIDGILGMDLLSRYDIDIDLPDNRVRLFKPVTGCASTSAFLQAPLYEAPMQESGLSSEDRPLVLATINGSTMVALIDTGAQTSALFRDQLHAAGLLATDLAADPRFFNRGIGPDAVRSIRHRMAPITVGDITVSNLPVEILDQHSPPGTGMILGMDFISRVHLWLSFSSRTVVMEYPPVGSPKL